MFVKKSTNQLALKKMHTKKIGSFFLPHRVVQRSTATTTAHLQRELSAHWLLLLLLGRK